MGQFRKNFSQRLSLLELAEMLGNVSEACRRQNITRTQFYEYKKRFQTMGLEGLKDIGPARKAHPHAMPGQVVERVLALSLEHPGWGCVRLCEELKRQGVSISSPTVQSILIKKGMGSKRERVLKLEEKIGAAGAANELSAEQLGLLEKVNPCFRERFSRGARPGEVLAQDAVFLGYLHQLGKVYLQAVVDTCSNYAFGFLHTGKTPDCAVAVLYNDVLPFFKTRKLPVTAIVTNNGREYCGRENHHYELFLLLNDIDHRRTPVRQLQANGFVKRFGQITIAEFFTKEMNVKNNISLETLQAKFDSWLREYNLRRPHCGYPNMGRTPKELLDGLPPAVSG